MKPSSTAWLSPEGVGGVNHELATGKAVSSDRVPEPNGVETHNRK